MKKIISLLFCIFLLTILSGQTDPHSQKKVDSLLTTMSLDEKIGQIFMIRAFSHNDLKNITFVKNLIKKYKPGGICFFQGSPTMQAKLTNDYQALSAIPMLVAIDGEWGLGMRFRDKAISFPKQLTLGAINDHNLIYEMGKEVAVQLKRIGIHVNFAPVVDVNNNVSNPVINFRSFGEDKDNVTSKGYAYMKGMQDGGLSACLKHFPGHGDTDVDSHHDLPIINHDRQRLDSIELAPFRTLISKGATGVMVAHLNVPAIDSRKNRATTLSKNVISDLLQGELNFEGLVYSDAMDMKGVTKHFEDGEAEFEAFLAGIDFIVLPEDLKKAFDFIKSKISSGALSEQRLNKSVRKILREKLKFDLLDEKPNININNIDRDITSANAKVLKYKLYEKSLTLVKNDEILPIINLNGSSFSSISLGSDKATTFQKRIWSYVNSENYYLSKDATLNDYNLKFAQLSKKDYVIVSLHNMSSRASKNYGLNDLQLAFIEKLSKISNVVLVVFGSPYSLKYFENVPCVLQAYEEDEIAQELAAQAVFGALDLSGTLPVSASKKYKYGHGISLPSIKRLGFAIPERVGLNSDTLNLIRELMEEMIDEKASPGAQILIAKDNKVVFEKAFGYHTYQKKRRVDERTIYDVASITKILASTISAMHLKDENQFAFNDSIAAYFAEEDTTNKSGMIYEDMMSHVAGLLGWIPFYKNTMKGLPKVTPSEDYYRPKLSDSFSVEVTENMFMREDYMDTIWRQVFSSRKRSSEYFQKNKYLYSDLAFYILNWTIERKTMQQVDEYAKLHFYDPMGLRYTGFNPLHHHPKKNIAPTERDNYFRMSKVQGFVHDMGAAMLGGVSGHAGLFSNSLEIANLMQMLLNGGYYGGKRYLDEKTIDYCTSRHPLSSRRGIGFDMKELDPERSMNMSELASECTFGHLGFTGCAAFVDPENGLIYIMLSNRTFPSMNNNRFSRNNYRPKVQSIMYRSLID